MIKIIDHINMISEGVQAIRHRMVIW